MLWENDGTTNPQTITLSEAYTNFDEIVVYDGGSGKGMASNIYVQSVLSQSAIIGIIEDVDRRIWYQIASPTILNKADEDTPKNIALHSIVGRRYTKVSPTGYRRVTLWENTGTTNPDSISLTEAITNFDEIRVVAHQNTAGNSLLETSFTVSEIGSQSMVLYALLSNYGTYSLTNSATLTKIWEDGSQGFYVYKIIGIKY